MAKSENDIKRIVEELVEKYQTRNPFELADKMGIILREDPLGVLKGYYIVYSGIKCICVNSDIDNVSEKKYIISHEIGHSVMHDQERFMFYPSTLFSLDKTEVEANRFATELLVPDNVIIQNPVMTKAQIASILGYDEKIMEFKKL